MNPFATATELLADLRAGRVTSSKLTEMYIGRIEKHDQRLNAVVERDFDRAREQARDADRGGGGVLRGLPITLKESFNGQPAPYTRCIFYPSVATLAGQPATAFPVGRSREGLPIGLQAIGPYLEDRTPIRFAALLAREIGGFAKPEGYDA